MRKAAPYAYCDACLALRLDTSLREIVTTLAALTAGGECERQRRVCYGCRRTLELTALCDSPPSR
jgi:hypothetical protein